MIGALIDKFVLWFVSKAFGLLLAIFVSFPYRQRMSHNNGIAGVGSLRIVDAPERPAHEFFAPGKVYPLRIRHASVTFLDDAMAAVRSISLKFADHHFDSPFDMELNTGRYSLFWSAVSFLKFASMRHQQWGVQYVEFYRKYPDAWRGAVESGRRDVSSFHNQRYYSKTPFLFIGTDGIRRYAKYRVTPFDDEEETGINTDPSEWDEANQRVLPHETRGRNYLKYEYEERVRRREAKYRLQIQLRMPSDDDPEICNNMVPWNEEVYPWMELAVFEIDRVLDWAESTRTTFTVNNMPKTLGVLPAVSIYDYNSLNYMRAHSEIARRARMLSYRVFGIPPPIPDNDNRNCSDWGQ